MTGIENNKVFQPNLIQEKEIIKNSQNLPKETNDNNTVSIEVDNLAIKNVYNKDTKIVQSVNFQDKFINIKNIKDFLSTKETFTEDEQNIAEFISKVNDENLQSILDAFDKMLEHSRKMMEEYKKYVKEVAIPKEEIQKIEERKEEIQKEIEGNKI